MSDAPRASAPNHSAKSKTATKKKPAWSKGPTRAKSGAKKPKRPAPKLPDDGFIRLFGTHAVVAALKNPKRTAKRLLATENAERRIKETLAAHPIEIDHATPTDLDRILGTDTVHQGLLLEADPLPEPTLQDLLEAAHEHKKPLIVLDHVTDPHNVGAVLRSAAAFGAAGLILTRRHSPPLNGVLAKSASGALELVPVLLVQNLAKTMEALKTDGVTLLGLAGDADTKLEDEDLTAPTALVFGAEGKGLRELTAETCDRLIRIETADQLASLNISNAAAVALHTALIKRRS